MSEIQKNEIPLIRISAPELNQSGYAEELSKTFENIDTNFATLANYDFIKGESGNSVVINAMPFFDENGNINGYGQKVKQYFETSFEDSARESIRDLHGNEITLFDNFTPEKAGYLYLISEFDNNVEEVSEPVTSLYYVFLDGRFANNKIGQINESDFSSIEDLSCILVYDKSIDGFKALENAFPTIYYEDKSGLCWKVNGSETGIPVKGQPGANGKDAIFQFVECKLPTDSNVNEYRQAEVTHIYQYPEHIDIADCDINDFNGSAAMILIKQADKHYLYFGQLKIKDNTLYAIYYENLEITKIKHTTDFINVLKGINFASADFNNLPGLFIPMDIETNTGVSMVQPAHLLAATSITNTRGDITNSKNADLLLTGVYNINGVSSQSKENLLVEKYLYVLANKKSDLFASNNQDIINSIKNLDQHGYILKYKLSSIIYDYNVLNSFEKFAENYENVKYFNKEVGGQNYSSAKDTIPENFLNRLDNNNSLGVYCWELCNSRNDFDKDIIPFRTIEGVSYNNNVKNYFGNIFTDTINPNGSSYFMWFNGIENISVNESNSILYGWGDDESQRPPMFSFKRFVPIFVNDFKSNIDTALNVNYNVNITGDNDNSKRNITINGALNSNNINTQQLYADEIKNIHTNDVITGNNGLQLGKKPSSGYYTTIDEFGNMNLQGVAEIGRIKCQKSLAAAAMSASSVTSKNLHVSLGLTDFVKIAPTSDVIPATEFTPETGGGATSRSGETNTTSNSNTSINLDYALNVEFNDVEHMSIKAAKDHKSKIDSTVPFISSENAGVIVSNVDSESDNVLFYYGATTNDNTVKNAYTFNINKVKQNASKNQTAGRNYKYNDSIKSTDALLQENNLMFINGDNGSKYKVMQQPSEPANDTKWKEYTIHSTTLSNNSGDVIYTFNNNKPITINFGYYMFIIDLYAEGAALDKNFPKLSADSYIKLHTFYKIDNNETEITSLTQELHFNEEHCNEKFIGVNRNAHINTSNGNGAECDRYQGYVIHPDSIVIKDKNILTTIKDAYDNKKTIEIIVRPEVFIKFTADNKKLINLKVSQLVPINTKYLYSGEQTTQIDSNIIQEVYDFENAVKKYTFNEDHTEHPLAWTWPSKIENVPGSSTSFTVTATVTSDNIRNTTVCQDGIVIRSGNLIFGIGDINDKGPSLFLYEHGQTTPLKSKLLAELLK